MTHSKLPWKLRTHANIDCFIQGPKAPDMPYALEVMGDDYNGYGDDEQRRADAEFIILACNSHDELLTALRNLVAAINLDHPDAGDAVAEAERIARAAIAKATAP